MGLFSSENKFPVDGRTVVITGGSQGMGRSVGRQLAGKGANVVIVARNVDNLQEATEHITAGATRKDQRFHFISADLTSPTEATRVLEETVAWNDNHPPDTVWCVAGSAIPSLFIDTETSVFQSQISQNYLSSVYISQAALKLWLKPSSPSKSTTPDDPNPQIRNQIPSSRHIIFTSSIVALYPIVGYAAYSPTKTALRTLCDTLSQELHLYPPTPTRPAVIPHCIFPATIFSPGLEKENEVKPAITKKLEEDDKGQTAEEVAAASIRGLERGEEMVATTFLGGLLWRSLMGSSRRSGWGVWDTLVGWAMVVVMVVVRWDMDGTVRKWARGEIKWEEGGGGKTKK